MKQLVQATFALDIVNLPLTAILPIRQVKPTDHAWGKYRSILASIREVGLIEPLVVHPQKNSRSVYLLLDGHMRLKALLELGRTEVACLVANDDDPYTYNDKVNRLSPIQEHTMILKSVDDGVAPEQIAKALDLNISRIKASLNLLDGIHPDVVELLKDKPVTASALRLFRKVTNVRQIDMAQLMVSANNYTRSYAAALLVGTPAGQAVTGSKPKKVHGISAEEVGRMEREMATLERDYRLHQDHFGENSLHLNTAQRYIKRLLDNPKVKRFLSTRYPEILEELQELVALQSL